MTKTETLYSAKQVASELRISSGMLRRYALAFEAITSQKIRQDPRDGRQYSSDQLATLQRAKAFVTSNPGMSVDHALRLAMGASEAEIARPPSSSTGIDAQALEMALERAVLPLLDEIRALRESNERLRAAIEGKEPSQKKKGEAIALSDSESYRSSPDQLQEGLVMRLARRIEKIVRRY